MVCRMSEVEDPPEEHEGARSQHHLQLPQLRLDPIKGPQV